MHRNTLVILVVVAAVLIPMWFVALHGEPPSEEIAIDQSVSEIQPLSGPFDTPHKLSPSQVGVIVWVALILLFGVLVAVHRFMNNAVRPPDDGGPETAQADGGAETAQADGGQVNWPWVHTDDRWIAGFHPASEDIVGLAAMGGLTVLSIVFAALFSGEYFTLARTQYIGVYAAGLFTTLALLTVAYYAWFLPHVEVAEHRGHDL